ncbi:MAG: DUF4834 family protein [Bacteroidales bacterium]|nr:DUF4834 family protein [Bacteroidales bacterium]
MGFIRLILLFIVIYLLIRIIMRYVVPVVFGNYMNRKMDEFSNPYNKQQNAHSKRKEGEVTVDTHSHREPRKQKDRGEYIDYEEVGD